jgi:hypothetical protein
MKRLLSVFSLGALLLLGLATPHAAQAAACTQVNPGVMGWPNSAYSQYCAPATSSDGLSMWGAIDQASEPTLTQILTYDPLTFWSFYNPADFQTYCKANPGSFPNNNSCALPSSSASAFSEVGATTSQVYFSVVFDFNGNGTQNGYIANSSAHEEGHVIDYVYSGLTNGQGKTKPKGRVSNSTLYVHEIAADWKVLNNSYTPCQPANVPGLFTNQVDDTGQYICNGVSGTGTMLVAKYKGDTNEQVLQAAWPFIFGDNGDIFAETYADMIATEPSIDYYWGNSINFACSKLLVQTLDNNGALPTAAQWKAAGCPTS